MGSILGNVAGAVVGGLMGGDGGGEQQTNTKEPWEPARKPLINSLNTGQDLERYYQQNPFNPLQQQGYQNLYSDLDQYRNQIQPALMNFANKAMTSNYQRGPRQSQMEGMQGMGGGMQQGSTRPQMMSQGADGSYTPQGGMPQSGGQGSAGGLLSAIGASQSQGAMPGGLLSAAQGAFSAPSVGNYGALDFAQLNPFTATNGIPKAPVAEAPAAKSPEDLAREEWERMVRSGEAYRGAGA